jgi:hypothetical protein
MEELMMEEEAFNWASSLTKIGLTQMSLTKMVLSLVLTLVRALTLVFVNSAIYFHCIG